MYYYYKSYRQDGLNIIESLVLAYQLYKQEDA
jgi:hypothetical protein